MENNRFHQFRHEIARISGEKDVDIGVAVSMLAQEKGWEDWGEEAKAFSVYVNQMPAEDRADYFSDK